MKLYLVGHDRRYAAEQTLLTLFPSERPEYPLGAPEGDRCELRLTRGARDTVCLCTLVREGQTWRGRAAFRAEPSLGAAERVRLENHIVKTAFYRAALRSGVPESPWGALSGVRPAKLMSGYLRAGASDREALSRFRREYFVSPERAALALDAARASERARQTLEPRDVCLYVGIPFCPTRCAYCSFVSASVEKSMALVEPYLTALDAEIGAAAAAARAAGLRVVSLYMGGGTPTTLSAPQLSALLDRLSGAFDLSAAREITVEAGRPDTITAEKLAALRARGVTRVSVNPQTMEDGVLEAIGRRHTAADVLRALALVRESGPFQVNMDLIAGLPTDTPEGFRRTLDTVLALAPENVTVHTLALKRGSRLTAEGGALPDAAAVGRMVDLSRERLSAGGWTPYYLYRQKYMSGGFENVGWARPGTENLYNVCIMEELCSILAVGAGGSTKLVDGGRLRRLMAPKYPLEYINGAEKLRAEKAEIEAFYHGL